MIREFTSDCKIRLGEEILVISLNELRERFDVDSVIRFRNEDFSLINMGKLTMIFPNIKFYTKTMNI